MFETVQSKPDFQELEREALEFARGLFSEAKRKVRA